MSFSFGIGELTFSGGTKVSLPKSGMVLLVGPNNAGKSRALRDIASRLGLLRDAPLVVATIETRHDGSEDEFWNWIREHHRISKKSPGVSESFSGIGFSVSTADIRQLVTHDWKVRSFEHIGRALVSHLGTVTRLTEANKTQAFDATEGAVPNLPVQALYASKKLEDDLNRLFRETFGEDLVVDRLGGSHIALRCGTRPDSRALGGRLSMDFAREAKKLPLLDDQGDGMRSFVACLLHTEILDRPVVLIDEPEAFLHPPQARRLALDLATAAKKQGRQFILATHSSDVVRGSIDAGADVTVIRVTRDGATNHAAALDAKRLAEMWKDPLLRASNLLDALFHRLAVVCEGDVDCRFYNAILEQMSEGVGRPRPEVLFTHTGGKDRIPVAVNALRAIEVPTIVIADLDILSNEQPLRRTWEALGHDWDEISQAHRVIKKAVDDTRRAPTVLFLRERIADLLDGAEGPLATEMGKKLRTLLRDEGGWTNVKKAGVSAVPKGEAHVACRELLERLSLGGLHVVPVGEVEGFVPDVGGHGPAWLDGALKCDLKADAKAAFDFVGSLGILGQAP